jgi:hypothetical protein
LAVTAGVKLLRDMAMAAGAAGVSTTMPNT